MANFKQYLFNEYDLYMKAGTYTWTKPSDIDDSKPILVHVWGAGGAGGDRHNNGLTANGGGAGGLAVKMINVSSLGATETITIGEGSRTHTGVGGTSSFGGHCSATGGNSGYNNTANEGSAAEYGIGGLGLQGDVNRRGGKGGTEYYNSTTNNGGGGGGGAPAPYGYRDGFKGGNASTYAGGGGGGIAAQGSNGSYTGGAGGGSMNRCSRSQSPSSYYTTENGGNGILGTGGTGGGGYYNFITYAGAVGRKREVGKGPMQIGPNEILLGGGGGVAGMYNAQSSGATVTNGSGGGPGAGGGGQGSNSDTNEYCSPGSGGFLGGGGGGGGYMFNPGDGGNAGGGGGVGYYSYRSSYYYASYTSTTALAHYNVGGFGGDGVVIVQYARKL